MASTAKERDSSETRSQETKELYREAKMIKYGKKVEEGVFSISFSDGWKGASSELKFFIMEECEEVERWEDIIEILKRRFEIEKMKEEEEKGKEDFEELKRSTEQLL